MISFKYFQTPEIFRDIKSLKNATRGYHFLKKKNNLSFVPKINKILSNTEFKKYKYYSDNFFFGKAKIDIELSFRQYLMTILINNNFNKYLLASIGKGDKKINYPLPKVWRSELLKNKFKINNFSNLFVWNLFLYKILLYGLFNNFKRLFMSIIGLSNNSINNMQGGIYFDRLTKNNLPSQNKKKGNHNIIEWYHNNISKNRKQNIYYHNVPNISNFKIDNSYLKKTSNNIPLPNDIFSISKFFIWFILAFLQSIFKYFKGNCIHMVFYEQASMSYLARIQKKHQIHKKYLLPQSYCWFKPLWTYQVESFGSKVYMYFYGVNPVAPRFKDHSGINFHYWELSNWKNYYVWNVSMKNFLKKRISFNNSNIEVVGPVYYESDNTNYVPHPGKTIALFDIEPKRTLFYNLLGIESEYYNFKANKDFIDDILKFACEYGYVVLHKRKRKKIGNWYRDFAYTKYIGNLGQRKNFISVDPDVSAYSVIDDCTLTVSMPFTSPSVYAKHIGKPAIFYDSTKKILKGSDNAHKVEVISGENELRTFFKNLKE